VAPHLGCHVNVDRVKIGIGAKTATNAKLKGPFCSFFFLRGQNRNFVKVRGLKLQLNLFSLHKMKGMTDSFDRVLLRAYYINEQK